MDEFESRVWEYEEGVWCWEVREGVFLKPFEGGVASTQRGAEEAIGAAVGRQRVKANTPWRSVR